MVLKEKILRQLEDGRGKSFSGEELAEKFGVSRAAVWKAIKALKEDGWNICGVTNRGYSLEEDNDMLSDYGIEKYVSFPCDLHVFSKVDSTNDIAKKQAEDGAKEWTVVVAEEQAKGRGRYNRKFVSSRGVGAYISIVLRPKFSAAETLFITTCAAVAVCEAIEDLTGKQVGIKWVNDVLMDGKKVCGILTEASFDVESGGLAYAVVGIGVNIKPQEFPDDIKNIAGSIFGEGEYVANGRAKLIAKIIEYFRFYYNSIPERKFFEEYKRRSIVIGKRVKVCSGNLAGEAFVQDIDENCFLKVQFDDGSIRMLSSGEVSVKL